MRKMEVIMGKYSLPPPHLLSENEKIKTPQNYNFLLVLYKYKILSLTLR
jgi:hypothetical protein